MKRLMVVFVFVSVVVVGASFAIGAEHGNGGEEQRGRLLMEDIRTLLAGVIVLTDRECATLGKGWAPYELMSGRFPLAAGSHTDAEGELQTFAIGDTSYGTYSHKLTVDEMPSHSHSYHDRHFNNARGGRDHGDDDDTDRHYINDRRNTGAVGKSQSHNNMPPYRVLNFCHLAGEE